MPRRAPASSPAAEVDTNSTLGALLRDLAAVQKSTQSKWGYKRAAAAVLSLDEPIESLVNRDGTLRKIPNIGPSSTRIVLEVLQTGGSPTVEQAVAASGRAAEVARSRLLRQHFLSRARVVSVLRDRTLAGPATEDYHGDLQCHSTWSDGADDLPDLARRAVERGYHFLAVTDHSYGLPIARGLSMAALAKQHREIDKLNRRYGARFRMLKGIEANILANGTVDMTYDELCRLDLVVAAPHSKLRLNDDQTPRMLGAVRTPGVHILGHPRGRMFGSRAGVVADWPKVFAEAARHRVAIEIDGDPARQDVDFVLAQQALCAGCLFALDSDGHSTSELRHAETAIAHARLAGIPASRIVNCWTLDELLDWTDSRSG